MKTIKYTEEQIDKIGKIIESISVKGSQSVTSLAMLIQELNNGIVEEEQIKKVETKKEGE